MRITIEIDISPEDLSVLSDISNGLRLPPEFGLIERAAWHATAKKMVNKGILKPWEDNLYYIVTEVGYKTLQKVLN